MNLRIRQTIRLVSLAIVTLPDCVPDIIAVPDARCWIRLRASLICRFTGLPGVHDHAAIDGESLADRRLAQATLESSLHSPVLILGYQAAAINQHVAVATSTIAIVLQNSRLLTGHDLFI